MVIEGPRPAHPFPSWVAALETGVSEARGVRERFGDPDEIEASPRGGLVWRYEFSEIHWPDGTKPRTRRGDRSAVADGELVQSRGALSVAEIGRWFRDVGHSVAGVVMFPPRQARRAPAQQLPARIHRLELVFGPDETLRQIDYRPREGLVFVHGRG